MFNGTHWLLKYSANFTICGGRTLRDLSALEAHSTVFKNDELWDWVGSFFFIIIILVINQPSHLFNCVFCKPIRHKKILKFWCSVILLLQRFLCFLDDKSSLPYICVGFLFQDLFWSCSGTNRHEILISLASRKSQWEWRLVRTESWIGSGSEFVSLIIIIIILKIVEFSFVWEAYQVPVFFFNFS